MERLPYIDEHGIRIAASAVDTWKALIETVSRTVTDPPAVAARAFRLDPTRKSGDWATVGLDHAVAGFRVLEEQPGRRLALGGAHRFSRYQLIFEIDETASGTVDVRAQTRADFPGIAGRIYRALVIGTRGHRLVVNRLLGAVKQRAERYSRQVGPT
ncbi:MAG: hypothetical protein HOQ24_12560 [Mycobacteriaceae bacterium]|nr:hypothetical protein [Mycobacteriaceae bacterium]